jgi:hypothetical protein
LRTKQTRGPLITSLFVINSIEGKIIIFSEYCRMTSMSKRETSNEENYYKLKE